MGELYGLRQSAPGHRIRRQRHDRPARSTHWWPGAVTLWELADGPSGNHTGHGCPDHLDGAPAWEVGVRRVLLLNITYEPLTTVGLHRAVCLVLGEKAEVVHNDAEGAVLHSASVILATPSVIRQRRHIRVT